MSARPSRLVPGDPGPVPHRRHAPRPAQPCGRHCPGLARSGPGTHCGTGPGRAHRPGLTCRGPDRRGPDSAVSGTPGDRSIREPVPLGSRRRGRRQERGPPARTPAPWTATRSGRSPRSAGTRLIGRQPQSLLAEAGFCDAVVHPRSTYAGRTRPALVDGFTRCTRIAVIESVRGDAPAMGLKAATGLGPGKSPSFAGPPTIAGYSTKSSSKPMRYACPRDIPGSFETHSGRSRIRPDPAGWRRPCRNAAVGTLHNFLAWC